MAILKDSVVSIHYTLRDEKGDIMDSSQGSNPLQFLFGRGVVIKGLENALADKTVGDSFNVKISPEDAYGLEVMENIQTVPLSQFQEKEALVVGTRLQLNDGTVAEVTKIDNDMVSLDFNHPLAGKTLDFDVTVEAVRDATSAELDQGQVQAQESSCGCSDPDCN